MIRYLQLAGSLTVTPKPLHVVVPVQPAALVSTTTFNVPFVTGAGVGLGVGVGVGVGP